MRNYVAEVIGTFILVFIGTGSVVVDQVTGGDVTLVGIALVWGLVVAAMVCAIGDVSGAHINPAVTIGLWVARRFEFRQVPPYLASQFLGAILASLLLSFLFPDQERLGPTLPAGPWMQSFVMEIMLTFVLMFVVLNVTVGAKEKGITAGLAIGGVSCFEVLVGGPISGASMNPARSLGPAVVAGELQYLWLYFAGPIIGSLLAVGIAGYLRAGTPREDEGAEAE